MLPILTVLLGIAQCALAAPQIAVSAYPISQYPGVPDSGRFINSFLIDGSSGFLDNAGLTLYHNMIIAVERDMADSVDISTQAGAVLSGIVTVGELASGIPGDSCETAALINAYAYYLSTGNKASLQQAVSNFIGRLNVYIDIINQLIVNPSSVKFAVGPRGTCLGGGRTYQFEEAWDGILSNANAYQIGLLNEAYCTARRMYRAFGISNNNVAAAVTAANIPAINQLAKASINELVPFLRAVANGNNPSQAAANAKASIAKALANISY